MVAATDIGICYVGFDTEINEIQTRFPGAIIEPSNTKPKPNTLHLRGTNFQIQVWRELLTIPFGQTTTYGEIARTIGHPSAHRAVGTAVGRNPISIIIPCHRVITANGNLGGYYWGPKLKKTILDYEKNNRLNEKDTNYSYDTINIFV